MVVRGRVHSGTEVDGRRANRDAVLAVVDPSAVGEDVDVGAFWSEFAVALYRENKASAACLDHSRREVRERAWERETNPGRTKIRPTTPGEAGTQNGRPKKEEKNIMG